MKLSLEFDTDALSFAERRILAYLAGVEYATPDAEDAGVVVEASPKADMSEATEALTEPVTAKRGRPRKAKAAEAEPEAAMPPIHDPEELHAAEPVEAETVEVVEVVEETTSEPEPEAEAPASTATLDDAKAAASAAIGNGNSAGVRAALAAVGAARVTTLEPEQVAGFLAALADA